MINILLIFVASSIEKVSIAKVSKASFPFLISSFVVLTLVTLFPSMFVNIA